MLKVILKTGLVAVAVMAIHQPSQAQTQAKGRSEHDVGEILTVATSFCPAGTLEANGQTVSIRDNQVLFSVIGTWYGGDGRDAFSLPNLIGREAIHVGTGPDLNTPRYQFQSELGGNGGSQVFYITADNIVPHSHMAPHSHGAESHSHTSFVSTHRGVGNTNTPAGGSFATFPVARKPYAVGEPDGGDMASSIVTVSKNSPEMSGETIGGSNNVTGSAGFRAEVAHRSPFLTIRYCIVTNGTYPLRD